MYVHRGRLTVAGSEIQGYVLNRVCVAARMVLLSCLFTGVFYGDVGLGC